MAKLCFQYWVINNNENLSNVIKIAQIDSKLCPIQNKPSKNSQRLKSFAKVAKFRPNWLENRSLETTKVGNSQKTN